MYTFEFALFRLRIRRIILLVVLTSALDWRLGVFDQIGNVGQVVVTKSIQDCPTELVSLLQIQQLLALPLDFLT
jgi:hypothetical protein